MIDGKEVSRLEGLISENNCRDKCLAIYFTVFGGTEEHPSVGSHLMDIADIYLITDRPSSFKGFPGIVLGTTACLVNPRITAKFFKVNPHRVFPSYKYSQYVDANCELKDAYSLDLLKQLQASESGVVMFRHNKRTSVYAEWLACLIYGKETLSRLFKLAGFYFLSRYPDTSGLAQGGFLLREHCRSECVTLMEFWWQLIKDYSERDQLLINIASSKVGCGIDYIEGRILHDSDLTRITPHRSTQFDRAGRAAMSIRSRVATSMAKLKNFIFRR